ncbi:N-acetylmuramoyl-L-alanine amidase [Petroclostridium sp. X23]|uniref:N-acetylmuramoyl-L-alanine amidase family protein n=1 Tax=Petroclostridium sp. X23 TaxID=3045146 RepID=UPI0024ADC23D|nr:N-acetylmuramoyl-L-alanine amidase [Petroclostridium sp. X23]WHH60560.1 N-acetylmuramoyl-L-alanine amidase [Petroclostridium sp. X23]
MKQQMKNYIHRLLQHFLYDILRPYIVRFVRHFIKHHLAYLIIFIAVSSSLIVLSPGKTSLENIYPPDTSQTPDNPIIDRTSLTNFGQDIMNGRTILLVTDNPYWDKVMIKGSIPADFKIQSQSSPYIIELPENFIEKINNEEVNSVFSKSIEGMSVQSIYDAQYIYINCQKNYPLRIYVDTVDTNILHIDIAKTENPYHSLVVIDPGHGGSDPGAINGDVCEKDIVLDIALRMEHKLKDLGVNTVYTRSTDKELYHRWITDYTNFLKPDAFVSIHNNSYEEPGPNGIATYYYTTGDYQKKERISLAQTLQDSLIKEFPKWTDMGIEKRDYWVVRKSDHPGALIEFGYISNPNDLANLIKPEIRERASNAIAAGINSFLKK